MNTQSITRISLLAAVALVLGFFERFIPIAATLPGIKLGLGNTVLLYAIYMMDKKYAFTLMLLKVLLSGLLYAGFNGAMFSFAGGLLSLIMMLAIKRFSDVSVIGVSVVGAVFHNIGQIVVAMFIVQTRSLLIYLPILIISGIATGILTGAVAGHVIKYIHPIYPRKTKNLQTKRTEKVLNP